MQFTRLRLNGFKSFVDPTDLVISPGLTGVVGPNGCGKSNLLEALRWIMGENRAKQMRGDGMDDVIFGGTDRRPTRNWATVELVIDNSDRLAPAAFNQTDRLEISRRITREVGSAYRINGKEVRARDVQMLFADASTGAHSPALVRQGQIAELINAKPKARRRILEEAAGISGLYQRRHEAELKLRGTESNLTRVSDLVEQLDQRLASLERQAKQAKRYREIAEELRHMEAVLLYLRWRSAANELTAAEGKLTEGTRRAAQAEAMVLAAAKERGSAEDALPPLREEETVAAAVLQRLTIERDQLAERETRALKEIEALAGRARQLSLDMEREEALVRDAHATRNRLTTEQAELTCAQDGHGEAEAAAREAARSAGETLSEQETTLDRLTEEAARLTARAAAAERRLLEARGSVERLTRDISTAEAAAQGLTDEIAKAEAERDSAGTAAEQAAKTATAVEQSLQSAETARAAAQGVEAETRAALADADGKLSALAAEVRGLERLLARESGQGDQLIDRVEVSPGYEAALGAALGEDLNACEAEEDGTGWTTLPGYDTATALPKGALSLAEKVVGPQLMTRRLSQTGVVAAKDGARLQSLLGPGQRIVSREGDLWRWDGLRVRAGDAASGAALRLQQRNRLAALRTSLAEAETAKTAAAADNTAARDAQQQAARAETEARTARREADARVADCAKALSRADSALQLARARMEAQTEALTARRTELVEAQAGLAEAEAGIADLSDVGEARAAVETQRGEVDLARTAMISARSKADEIRRAGGVRAKRLGEVSRELSVWDEREENAGTRVADLTRRISETAAQQTEAERLPEELAKQRAKLSESLALAEDRRRKSADALAVAEGALKSAEAAEREAERLASAAREERARLDAVREGLADRTAEAAQEIATAHEVDPEALLAELGSDPDELPPLTKAEAEATRLRRQRDALGAVNLRAEQDAEEVRTERDAILLEKADLDQAIDKLRGAIAELNRDGRARLLAAFDTVNERFAKLFSHLFGGGEARLVMVESDDPLEAGLEIMCQPPGKKLSTLSLLSGGEQTLTALSLIFAVFLANPAPVCVLDEVDAPLDDSNVIRFCDLLDEMRRVTGTRFLIITHHAITMSRMDRLFGVTMAERGVSQLVSVDLARATEMIDA